jgi:isopenicillin-N N-acyltransferase-like protein
MTSLPSRYPELTVSGSSRQMGEQIGEALREQIHGFDAIALERVRKTMDVSRQRALAVARRCTEDVRGYAPHMLEELEGMTHASGLPVERLMLLQMRNQLQPDSVADAGGCTSFALGGAAGSSITGQNWDNDPALDPFSVVLTRRPVDAPAFLSITQAGLIAYLGVNDAGIGLCMNTLPAPARVYGVPHYFTVRGIYEARSLEQAVQAVRRAQRAIPANLMLATPDGPADLEVTLEDVYVLRDSDAGPGAVTHTNHCVHPDLAPINADFPELIQSGPRKCRVDEMLAAAPRPIPRATLENILRDHQDHPQSICRHSNDHPTTGFWTSVWSLLIDADAGQLHLSRGNPCEQPYETYALN